MVRSTGRPRRRQDAMDSLSNKSNNGKPTANETAGQKFVR
jgi:hypothetical protein